MDELALVFVLPLTLFLIFVAPTWLFLHYRSKRRAESALSDEERVELERLTVAAGQMSERVQTLESILDERTPDWRNRIAAGP